MPRVAPFVALALVAACRREPVQPTTTAPSSAAPTVASASSAPAASASASASVPAEPPYDLAVDLATRTKKLRTEVGDKTKFEVVESVFLVAAPNGVMGSSAVVTKKALEAYFNGRFDKRPQKAIAVILFDAAKPYDAFCKSHWGSPCSTPYGFYTPDIRTVVMNVAPGIGTLTHELVHPIVEADFPKAPDWINEGLASLYEAFALPKPGEIRGAAKNWRLPRLRAALSSKAERPHASLPALFAMSDDEFRGAREDLNYATARYFCEWLEGQNKLWAFYHAWRDDYAKDPTGEKAFSKVMGKSPAELDAQWASWVKAL